MRFRVLVLAVNVAREVGRICGPENDADFRTGLVTRTVVVSAAVLFRASFPGLQTWARFLS